MKFGYARIDSDTDSSSVVVHLEQEFPDGWVLVKGSPKLWLNLARRDEWVDLFASGALSACDDRCRYCRHSRGDHDLAAAVGCNQPLCVCFHFEEPTLAPGAS